MLTLDVNEPLNNRIWSLRSLNNRILNLMRVRSLAALDDSLMAREVIMMIPIAPVLQSTCQGESDWS